MIGSYVPIVTDPGPKPTVFWTCDAAGKTTVPVDASIWIVAKTCAGVGTRKVPVVTPVETPNRTSAATGYTVNDTELFPALKAPVWLAVIT